MRESGYKCTNEDCVNIIPILKLDKYFGKKRKEMKCKKCGENCSLQEAEKVYSESDLEELFKNSYAQTDKSLQRLNSGTPEFKEIRGRRKQITIHVKKTGLEHKFYNEMGVQVCKECGNRNYIKRKECVHCGGFLPDETQSRARKEEN